MSDPVVLLSTGDVVGPAGGVTDNSMVLFSGTSGKLIKGNNAQVTAAGLALLDDVDNAAQRTTLGLKTAAIADVQTGATDKTAGRVLVMGTGRAGPFGLGGGGAPDAINLDSVSADPTGWYVHTSGMANFTPPPGQTDGLVQNNVRTTSGTLGQAFQLYFNISATGARKWIRSANNSTWSGWAEEITSDAFAVTVAVTDANQALLPGTYKLDSPYTNGPLTGPCTIQTSRHGSSYTQIAIGAGATTGNIYFRTSAAGTWGAWAEALNSTNNIKISGPTDSTPGRLVTTGGGGLLIANVFTGNIDDLNSMPNGSYFVAPSATGTRPVNTTTGHLLVSKVGTSLTSDTLQVWQPNVSNPTVVHSRVNSGGVWGSWWQSYNELYWSVNQGAGYSKLPGGNILQWGLATGITVGNAATNTVAMTYPVAFKSNVRSTISGFVLPQGGSATGFNSTSLTGGDLYVANLSGGTKTYDAKYWAIGQ